MAKKPGETSKDRKGSGFVSQDFSARWRQEVPFQAVGPGLRRYMGGSIVSFRV